MSLICSNKNHADHVLYPLLDAHFFNPLCPSLGEKGKGWRVLKLTAFVALSIITFGLGFAAVLALNQPLKLGHRVMTLLRKSDNRSEENKKSTPPESKKPAAETPKIIAQNVINTVEVEQIKQDSNVFFLKLQRREGGCGASVSYEKPFPEKNLKDVIITRSGESVSACVVQLSAPPGIDNQNKYYLLVDEDTNDAIFIAQATYYKFQDPVLTWLTKEEFLEVLKTSELIT